MLERWELDNEQFKDNRSYETHELSEEKRLEMKIKYGIDIPKRKDPNLEH